jgi:hypothetical protein
MIASEKEYIDKLHRVYTLIKDILRKRKTASKRASVSLITKDKEADFSAQDLNQFNMESEDLKLLEANISDIFQEQQVFLTKLQECHDSKQYSNLGRIFLDFADAVHRKYIVYAVTTLSDLSEASKTVYQKSMENGSRNLVDIIETWISNTNVGLDEEVTDEQWRAFLAFPLERVDWYTSVLRDIIANQNYWEKDNMYAQLAFIKLGSLSNSIAPYAEQ